MSNEEGWLCAILGCGTLDISVIDCEYDKEEIVQDCYENFGKLSLNDMSRCIVDRGLHDLQVALDTMLDDLNEAWDENDKELCEECSLLYYLDPYKDIESYHNFLDTSVYFVRNKEIWRKYLGHAIERFEKNTGYSIGG